MAITPLFLLGVIAQSESAYKAAYNVAQQLEGTHPIRLGLALNFSVFYYEIKNDQEQACNMAKEVCFTCSFNLISDSALPFYNRFTIVLIKVNIPVLKAYLSIGQCL